MGTTRLTALGSRLALAAAFGLAPVAPAAIAQPVVRPLPLEEGTRVRIQAPSVNLGRRIEGSVLRLVLDTVVVDTAPDWRTHRFFGGSTIPLDSLRRIRVHVDSIRRLQVSTERSRLTSTARWFVRGAIFGALIGGISSTPQRNPTIRDIGDGALIGAPVGAGIGLLYGLFNPGDRWRDVRLPAIGVRRLGR